MTRHWGKQLEKLYAELLIKINKLNLNEKALFEKWQQIIKDYQNRGIDVADCSVPERSVSDEICVAVRAGETTQSPDYKQMYSLLGEFIQFLYEEIGYVGRLNIILERKCRVFEIQTDIP
jgi:hypothetical protein